MATKSEAEKNNGDESEREKEIENEKKVVVKLRFWALHIYFIVYLFGYTNFDIFFFARCFASNTTANHRTTFIIPDCFFFYSHSPVFLGFFLFLFMFIRFARAL